MLYGLVGRSVCPPEYQHFGDGIPGEHRQRHQAEILAPPETCAGGGGGGGGGGVM